MKVTLKKRALVDLYDAMKQIGETEKNKKLFTYALTLNEENLKSQVFAILGCGIASDEYKKYEQEREKLIKNYAQADADGNFVADGRMIKIKSDCIEEAKKEFELLDVKYSDVMGQRNDELKEYYEILDSDIKVEIETVPLDYFPSHINKIMMKALQPLIPRVTIGD